MSGDSTNSGNMTVNLFLQMAGAELTRSQKSTLVRLSESRVDLEPILALYVGNVLSLPVLQGFLTQYRLVKLKRLDGSIVAAPTSSELLGAITRKILSDAVELRYPFLSEALQMASYRLLSDNTSIKPLIESINEAPKKVLAAIIILHAASEAGLIVPQQALANFINGLCSSSKPGIGPVITFEAVAEQARQSGIPLSPESIAAAESMHRTELEKTNRNSGKQRSGGRSRLMTNMKPTSAGVPAPRNSAGSPIDKKGVAPTVTKKRPRTLNSAKSVKKYANPMSMVMQYWVALKEQFINFYNQQRGYR
jgi:hypothetical protein